MNALKFNFTFWSRNFILKEAINIIYNTVWKWLIMWCISLQRPRRWLKRQCRTRWELRRRVLIKLNSGNGVKPVSHFNTVFVNTFLLNDWKDWDKWNVFHYIFKDISTYLDHLATFKWLSICNPIPDKFLYRNASFLYQPACLLLIIPVIGLESRLIKV